MKKIVFIILTFMSISVFAQNKFVKIYVADTIAFHPKVYKMTISSSEKLANSSIGQDSATVQQGSSYQNFDSFLVNHNIYYTLGDYGKTYHVTCDSDRCLRLIEEETYKADWDVEMKPVVELDESEYVDKLYQKIFTKSKKEAELLAKINGQTISGVLSIEELSPLEENCDDISSKFRDRYVTGLFQESDTSLLKCFAITYNMYGAN